ncbi:hypothetical protein GCM10025880_32630 [Methylorubrum aminovorans]|nr:hypothetical protein [Methylorubrum aminovorans]GMA76846.1 hypothetical protein GCM10025880_32630 [Methylorubrum aminovorans]
MSPDQAHPLPHSDDAELSVRDEPGGREVALPAADAVILDDERDRLALVLQRHAHRGHARRVLGDVGERFLAQPVEGDLHVRGEVGLPARAAEIGRDAASRAPIRDEAAQRDAEPEIVERGGTQLDGDAVEFLRHLVELRPQALDLLAPGGRGDVLFQRADPHGQRRDELSALVVKVSGEAQALLVADAVEAGQDPVPLGLRPRRDARLLLRRGIAPGKVHEDAAALHVLHPGRPAADAQPPRSDAKVQHARHRKRRPGTEREIGGEPPRLFRAGRSQPPPGRIAGSRAAAARLRRRRVPSLRSRRIGSAMASRTSIGCADGSEGGRGENRSREGSPVSCRGDLQGIRPLSSPNRDASTGNRRTSRRTSLHRSRIT